MATVRTRKRLMCSSCGQRCFVEPVEVMLHSRYRQQRVWDYISLVLCPPCRVTRYDWWHDQVLRDRTRPV